LSRSKEYSVLVSELDGISSLGRNDFRWEHFSAKKYPSGIDKPEGYLNRAINYEK
jgi:hypothetical protein